MDTGNRRQRIAVILASMDVEYAYDTLSGIEDEAHAQGMDVYIFNSNAGTDEKIKHNIGEYNIYNLVDYTMFDGVILFANLIQGYSVYSSVIDRIRASGVIAVSIDAKIEGFYFVGVDNYEPMKMIVNHMIEKHHYTKINYISGQDFNSDSRERLAAYRDALREHNIPVEERRIYKGAFTNIHGRYAALEMLEFPETMPEAVVCATDSLAIGARTIFTKYGLKIPQQIALTGFDNLFEARNSLPRFTTVSRNQDQVGHEAVLRIVRRLKGEEVPLEERFPATPIFRESCGCCTGEKEDVISLREKYVETSEHYVRHLLQNNMLIEDLNDSRNFEDFLERLKSYVKRLECDAFYLCLDQSLVEDLKPSNSGENFKKFHDIYRIEGFPEMMSVVLAYENGAFVSCADFTAKQMIPRIPNTEESAHTNIFLPVHFRDRSMGYVMVKNCKYVMSSPLFRTWLINLSNGLESFRKQMHLKSMVERLDRMYVMDSLTGLYNRFGFSRYTGESFSKCVGQGNSFMILFADLDGLKIINDQYGHDNGDVAISTVAYALQNACLNGEICARVGGDEFVVYAEGYTAADASAYCKRLDDLLEHANEEIQKPYKICVSYGYEIVFPEVGDTLDRYIDLADNKMYVNKKKKKELHADNVRIFS